jgi:hypothetical protein
MLQTPLEEMDQILSFQLLLPLEAGEGRRVVKGLELGHQEDQGVEAVPMAQGREVLETRQVLPHRKEIMVEIVSLPSQIFREVVVAVQGQ